MLKSMLLPGRVTRFPMVGAVHVLASVPTTRLCFFRAAPTSTVGADSNIEEGSKSWALVKYVEPVLESFSMRALVERITPAVLETTMVTQVVDDVAEDFLDIHGGLVVRDTRTNYRPEVFQALFFPPRHAVVEDSREALVLGIFRPTVEPALAPVPVDFILSLAEKAVACRSVVPEAVSPIPSVVNEHTFSSSPSSPDASISSTIITPPSSPSSSSASSSPLPSTPSSASTASFECTPIRTRKNKENSYLATPSPTPPRTQERSRPRILMPFVNRLVAQHQSSNARIPFSGQAVTATPSPPPRSGRMGKKNGKSVPRTPARTHLPDATPRQSMLATPPRTPSPASYRLAKPAGHGKENAVDVGMEKHWRKRRPKTASVSPLGDNVYATPSATPTRSKPSAQ